MVTDDLDDPKLLTKSTRLGIKTHTYEKYSNSPFSSIKIEFPELKNRFLFGNLNLNGSIFPSVLSSINKLNMFGENLELKMSPSFFTKNKSPSFLQKKVTELVCGLKSHRVFYKKKSPSW